MEIPPREGKEHLRFPRLGSPTLKGPGLGRDPHHGASNRVHDEPLPLDDGIHQQEPTRHDHDALPIEIPSPDDDVHHAVLVFEGDEAGAIGSAGPLTPDDKAADKTAGAMTRLLHLAAVEQLRRTPASCAGPQPRLDAGPHMPHRMIVDAEADGGVVEGQHLPRRRRKERGLLIGQARKERRSRVHREPQGSAAVAGEAVEGAAFREGEAGPLVEAAAADHVGDVDEGAVPTLVGDRAAHVFAQPLHEAQAEAQRWQTGRRR